MALRSDLLEPIEGANPAGVNLRYEPVYDQIKQARIEEDDVPQGEWKRERKTADYALVIKLAGEVLARQSKDLQLAAWLTEALLRREGFAGLRQGLELLQRLLETFWDHLHPELEDGDAELRAAPLEWVGQYLDGAVRRVPLNQAGHDFGTYKESRVVGYEKDVEDDSDKKEARQKAIQEGRLSADEFDAAFEATPKAWYKELAAELNGATAALAALEQVSDERFGRDGPSFHRLRTALTEVGHVANQLLSRKLEAEPDPPEMSGEMAAAEGGGSGGGAAGAEGAAGVPGGISPMPRTRDDAAGRVAAAARFLRAEAPTDPGPYLMLRGFRWGELRARGDTVDPKLLAAPPTEVRTRLKSMLLDAKWAELLEAAEEVMATPYGRGWLDLQRYMLTACEELGAEYDHVAAAVRGALRALLRDLPALPQLTMMDDTPTANAETRAWLRDAGILRDGGEAEEDEEEPPVEQRSRPGRARTGGRVLERALERARAGEPEKAVELLMREAAQEKSARARFIHRSEAAAIMVDAGFEAVAMPLLKEIVQQIEKHGLEEWETPEAIARPLGLMYRCVRSLEGDNSEARELYLRVCRLDPIQAMQLTGAANDDEPGG